MLKNLVKKKWILIILIVLLFGSCYFLYNRSIDWKLKLNAKKNQNWFLKNLHENDTLNKVSTILVETKEGKLTIVKNKENWIILEKANYPALSIKIKELIFGLAELKIVDSKTSNPNNFAIMDLKDLESSENITKISFFTDKHEEIDSIYIGKREFIATPNVNYQNYIFVRRPFENQVWLVAGNLPEGFSFKELVKQPLINLDLNKIYGVKLIKTKDPKNFINIKRNSQNSELKLIDLPKGYKLKDQYLIDSIIQQFTYLNYEDVIKEPKDTVSVLQGKLFLLNEIKEDSEQNKKKDFTIDFELVYLNNNYYLKLFSNLTEDPKNNQWLYKISDYVCQSLLINKYDLLEKI